MLTIFSGLLSDADLEPVLKQARETLTAAGATIKEEVSWGKQRFAYPIKGMDQGTYVLTTFDIDQQALREYGNTMRMMEGVVRFMITEFVPRPVAPKRDGVVQLKNKTHVETYTRATEVGTPEKPDAAAIDAKLDEILSDESLAQ